MPCALQGLVLLLGRYEMGVNMESLHAFRANSWFSKPLEASIHIMVSGQFPRYLTLYDALSSSGPDEIRKYYQSIIDILLYSNYSVSNRDALWCAIIESESTYERISNAKSYAAYLVETYKTIRGFTSKSVSKGIWGRFIKQYKRFGQNKFDTEIVKVQESIDECPTFTLDDKNLRDLTFHYSLKDDSSIGSVLSCLNGLKEFDFKRLGDNMVAFLDVHRVLREMATEMLEKLSDDIDAKVRSPFFPLPLGIQSANLQLNMVVVNSLSQAVLSTMDNKLGQLGTEGHVGECHDYLLMVEADIISVLLAYSRSQTDLERRIHLSRNKIYINSALSRLYGYEESKRNDTLWRKMIKPAIGKHDAADDIEADLNAYTQIRYFKPEVRNALSHYQGDSVRDTLDIVYCLNPEMEIMAAWKFLIVLEGIRTALSENIK